MDKDLCDRLRVLVHECDNALADFVSLTRRIPRNSIWSDAQSSTMGALYTACLRTSGSVLVLVENSRIWDADILIRSVTEGSLKITYLLSSQELFEKRYIEFSEALFEIEGIKQHRKAEALLEVVGDSDAARWKPIRELLLSDEVFSTISEKYSRSERRAIETKWGFTGIVSQLAKGELATANMFLMLLHGYSMASHHLHADYTGVCSALERDTRDMEQRDAVYAAHAARIISDVFWLAYARLHAGYQFTVLDMDPLNKLVEKYDYLNNGLSTLIEEWGAIEYGSSGP